MKRVSYLIVAMLLLAFLTSGAFAEEMEPVITASPPTAPHDVIISGITDVEATVSWSPVAGSTQYSIWVNNNRWTGSNSPGATIHNLQPYSIYDVYVTAANESGESIPSSIVNFVTLPPVPTAPAAPLIVNITGDSALVQWSPLPVIQYIQAYRVYVDGVAVADVEADGEGLQEVSLTNLHDGDHTVYVSGINTNQEGPPSIPVQFTISQLPAPNGLLMTNHSQDTIWLSWDATAGAEKYIISANGQLIGETSGTSYILAGLEAEQNYEAQVVAILPNGDSSAPATIEVETLPPATPMAKDNILQDIYNYISDIFPGLLMIFVIGGAFAIARAAREPFANRMYWLMRR